MRRIYSSLGNPALRFNSTNPESWDNLALMSTYSDSPTDRLWDEYSLAFRDVDDLTLARWMAQTLGQLTGQVWRLSHPLVGTYRLACRWGHERQVWLKRLVTAPSAYSEAGCCRAPLLPLLTRDALESGLICHHCGETAVPFDEIPLELQEPIRDWTTQYAPVHAIAHWDDDKRRGAANYDETLEQAAGNAEKLLAQLGAQIMPKLLDFYPAVIWEDQDECLEVRPEDIMV
jgi:hypothetical protein